MEVNEMKHKKPTRIIIAMLILLLIIIVVACAPKQKATQPVNATNDATGNAINDNNDNSEDLTAEAITEDPSDVTADDSLETNTEEVPS